VIQGCHRGQFEDLLGISVRDRLFLAAAETGQEQDRYSQKKQKNDFLLHGISSSFYSKMRAYVIDLQGFIINGAAADTAERVPPFSSCLVTACRHGGFIQSAVHIIFPLFMTCFLPGMNKRPRDRPGDSHGTVFSHDKGDS
jgi:hypothetical protein